MQYIWQLPNWTEFTWQSDQLLKSLGKARSVQSELLTLVKNLGLEDRKEARQLLLVEETIKTAKIEGEIYIRDSVRSSIIKNLGLPGAHYQNTEPNIDGLVQAFLDATVNFAQPLTQDRIKSWHAALFPTGYSGMYKIETGQWRSGSVAVVSGVIGREKVHYVAPPAESLDHEMKSFLSWWSNSEDLEGLIRAAIAHFWFVMIHPFSDGNGRITRILTEMALAEDECLAIRYYSLSSQIMDDRSKYYDVLQQCQIAQRDITPWIKWFLENYTNAIKKSQVIIGNVLDKADFWQKNNGVILNKKQQKVVNKLLDVGKGGFIGGLTTRKYSAMTKVSKATASRDIRDLLAKGILLKNDGRGRSVNYNIKW